MEETSWPAHIRKNVRAPREDQSCNTLDSFDIFKTLSNLFRQRFHIRQSHDCHVIARDTVDVNCLLRELLPTQRWFRVQFALFVWHVGQDVCTAQ